MINQENFERPRIQFFNEDLQSVASLNADSYRKASPFPHIVLDGLFPEALLNKINLETEITRKDIRKSFYGAKDKLTTEGTRVLRPETTQCIQAMNSPEFIAFVENLTGIKGLVADPDLEGGGIHEILPGGFLKIHSDFNWNMKLKLHRRVNLLLYLNPDWKEEYGGHLELWDEKMQQCRSKISPLFNRLVLFSTSDVSYHGHPEPLTCPPGRSRRSLALYYYSKEPSENKSKKTRITTEYVDRPGENMRANRPLHRKAFESLPLKFQEIVYKLLKH